MGPVDAFVAAVAVEACFAEHVELLRCHVLGSDVSPSQKVRSDGTLKCVAGNELVEDG
jgi:hypothetical protein